MAAVAVGPLDRRCSSAVSVDIDPGWYEGQPETADTAADIAAATAGSSETAVAASAAALSAPSAARSHVPTVLTKLQKWGDYESFGEPVWPTKFIPMKTPLSHEILDNWQLPEAPKHRLTVSTLLEAERAAGRRVGLLLDLSNHDCLYDIDIPPDVAYIHVQLVAKELPPLEFVREVGRAASGFWAQHPDQYIAIHCAYGFNRTGFVVCSYLIEHCGLTVDQALHSFASSRPPGVKHERFKQELWARYGSSNSRAAAQSPQQPSTSSSSSSTCTTLRLMPQQEAAAPVAAVCASADGPSCSTCGNTSASSCSTGAAWGEQPQGGCRPEQRLSGCSPNADVSSAAASSAPAAAVPRCCCCNAPFSTEEAAMMLGARGPAGAATVAAAGQQGQRQQQAWPAGSSSSIADEPVSSSSTSCFARSSSLGAFAPTPPPLPPQVPSHGLIRSNSRSVLSSSPGLRLSGRCWSSNSVGDNSSIGCSPSSSTADLVLLRTSALNSAASSGLDSSNPAGQHDTPRTPLAALTAAGAAVTMTVAAAVGRDEPLSQQWLGGGVGGVHNNSSSSSHPRQWRGSGSSADSGGGSRLMRGSSGEGCSATGGCDEDAAEDSTAEEGCFEMDPCSDTPQHQQHPVFAQQPAVGGGSGQQGGPRKSVSFQDGICCQQAAPGCCSRQQLHTADLDSLLASVSITQQQQQQQQQEQQQQHLLVGQDALCKEQPDPNQQQQQLQQQYIAAAEVCGCSCHSIRQSLQPVDQAASPSNTSCSTSQGLVCGSSIQRPPAGCAEGGSSGEGRVRRCWYQQEEGGLEPAEIENESFGKLTSDDLLKNLRAFQRQRETN